MKYYVCIVTGPTNTITYMEKLLYSKWAEIQPKFNIWVREKNYVHLLADFILKQ